MPLRVAPFRAALHYRRLPAGSHFPRLFHATSLRSDDNADGRNHYETLDVETNASPADIKKSFYALSKAHHPDHNQSDPAAKKRFVRISEAYGVLGNAESRARYDRDVLRLHHRQHHPHQQQQHPPGGGYAPSGPAGSRPASGLSRRRGTFRGPPPSFYRAGGWGAHGARRAAAHEESTGGGPGAKDTSSSSSTRDDGHQQKSSGWYAAHGAGGMGPGQEPFGKGSSEAEIPHFDSTAQAAHTRTQERVWARRFRREAEGGTPFPGASSDFGEIGSFFVVLAVLGIAVGFPYLMLGGLNSGNKDKKIKKRVGADAKRVAEG